MAQPRKLTPAQEVLAIDAYRAGFSTHTIALHVPISPMGLTIVLRRNGVTIRDKGTIGLKPAVFAEWRAGWVAEGTDTVPAPPPVPRPRSGGRWVDQGGGPLWVPDSLPTGHVDRVV